MAERLAGKCASIFICDLRSGGPQNKNGTLCGQGLGAFCDVLWPETCCDGPFRGHESHRIRCGPASFCDLICNEVRRFVFEPTDHFFACFFLEKRREEKRRGEERRGEERREEK